MVFLPSPFRSIDINILRKFFTAFRHAPPTPGKAAEKPAIVLVHGAFEDAHVWYAVVAKLQTDGYRVINVNLPGRPGAPLAADLVSGDLYRDTVLKAIDVEAQPVVLVGHSFGGIAISAVAEAAPARIRTAVYLAAYLPRHGESMLSLVRQDRDSQAGAALRIDEGAGMISVDYAARADLFANGAPQGMREMLANLIIDEPLRPVVTPVALTAARFGMVDKVYIHTTLDRVVSPYLQQKMVDATPVRMALTLEAGHTPFLTDVIALVHAIEQAAR